MIKPREYGKWSPSEDGVILTWSELSVYVRQPHKSFFAVKSPSYKKIINNVTGVVEPGQLVALIGSSGAGKSTLMSCLANRIPGELLVDGDIRVNGRKIGDFMQRFSGFMYQEDLFFGSLTVYEHLNLMAKLKLDRRVSQVQRERIISNLITELNLSSCSNTRIGGSGSEKEKTIISGGERKRVAFATECLTNPLLLFCDEPTTGLDSSSAHYLVKMLQRMAVIQKRTVLCTIHQPSSDIFEMFHQIILVANGRIAFIGPTDTALEFFKSQGYECPLSYNPADFLISILASTPGSENTSRQAVKRICDQFAVSDHAREIEMKVQFELHMGSYDSEIDNNIKHLPLSWIKKLYWLCYRQMIDIIRDPQVQTLRIIQKIGLAVMIGLCFIGTLNLDQKGVQAIQGALFMLVTENTFAPMYAVLSYFPTQIPMFIREFQNGICTPSQFYLANIISMLPGLIVEPFLFVSLLYWISGLKTTLDAFFLTVIAVILCINVSSSCGVFFSTAFDNVPIAMAYLIPFDYSLMVTSGIFINLKTIPKYISWIQNISWMKYTNEALNIVQWNNVNNITCETNRRIDLPCLENGLDVLERSSYSAENYNNDVISMLVLYFTFNILGFICLYLRIRGKKPIF